MTEMQLNYLRQIETERANQEAERLKDEANLLKSRELDIKENELSMEQQLLPYRQELLSAQQQAQLANVSLSDIQRLAATLNLPGSAGYRAALENAQQRNEGKWNEWALNLEDQFLDGLAFTRGSGRDVKDTTQGIASLIQMLSMLA